MRKDRFPTAGRKILDLLLSIERKVPETPVIPAPHVVIRTIRNALRMTQAQLARRAGLPQSHLAKIETGKVDVQLSTIRRILGALHCDLAVLPKFRKTPRAAVAERIREVARRKTAKGPIRAEIGRLMISESSEIWDDPPPASEAGGASVVRDRSQWPIRLLDKEDARDDLRYWLGKSPAERVGAVEFLREQFYELSGHKTLPRLSRAVRVVDRPS